MSDKIKKASGLGRGIMSGIASASRAMEIRRRMMEDDSDSDLNDSPIAKKPRTRPLDSDSEADEGPTENENEKKMHVSENSPQNIELQEKAEVDLTQPRCLFDFSTQKLDSVKVWAGDCLEFWKLPDFLKEVFRKKGKYYNAMEQKVVTSYVLGKLAPSLDKSEIREEFAIVILMLAFLVYFSDDDVVAVLAYQAFCEIDDFVEMKHKVKLDLSSNFMAIFHFYGASSSFPSPDRVDTDGGSGSKGDKFKLTDNDLFLNVSDDDPSMDSVMRFSQALKVFHRVMKRQFRSAPESLTECREPICVNALLALTDVVSPTVDEVSGVVVAGQGRHSELGSTLEDIVASCIDDQPPALIERVVQSLYERDPQRFNFTARALVALRGERHLFRGVFRWLCKEFLQGRREGAFEMYHGVEWTGADEASEQDVAEHITSLMVTLQDKLSRGPTSIDVNEVETSFFLLHSFLLTGSGLDQKLLFGAFKEAVGACEFALDHFDDVDKTLKDREEFVACKRTCSELISQIRAVWDDVEAKARGLLVR